METDEEGEGDSDELENIPETDDQHGLREGSSGPPPSPPTHAERRAEHGAGEASKAAADEETATTANLRGLLAKLGSTPFPIDINRISELPGQGPQVDVDKAAGAYVPDHVLIDSFTAISERKTWYRISRQGSSRKHNAGGDDENYRRITWPTIESRWSATTR